MPFLALNCVRSVGLQVVCKEGEVVCVDDDTGARQCSTGGGFCLKSDAGAASGGTAAAVLLPPQLQLRGAGEVSFEQRTAPYTACAGTQAAGCELGAEAALAPGTSAGAQLRLVACEDKVRLHLVMCVAGVGGMCCAAFLQWLRYASLWGTAHLKTQARTPKPGDKPYAAVINPAGRQRPPAVRAGWHLILRHQHRSGR